jgi:soluble lytic murein transglycosylase-like protein
MMKPEEIWQSSRQPLPPSAGPAYVNQALFQLEGTSVTRRFAERAWSRIRRPLLLLAVGGLALVLGAATALSPDSALNSFELRQRLFFTKGELLARTGELKLVRLQLTRMQTIHEHSARYNIPADLAANIYDIAVAEGIDPALAFSLVRVESRFTASAVSSKGAVGLTQVMPNTAFSLEPGVGYRQLFDEETNLRLGFRYLRQMIQYYRGDLHLALLAYNRGPNRVEEIRRSGGDPSNGYSQAVLDGR